VDVARNLREARRRARLTQAGLARAAGTSQATISAYEKGRKQPSIATLTRLLAATGSRLEVEPGHARLIEPSANQLQTAGRQLIDVLALAEALPSRPERELRFPRLSSSPSRGR
jgi:transcriptional regulator with XRE-family HTH domain